MNSRLAGVAWTLGIILVLCAIWEGSVRLLHIRPFVFPSIEQVIGNIVQSPSVFLRHAGFTVASALAGFVIAGAVGLVLAVAIVASRTLDRVLITLLALVHSVPKVALAPLFVLWLGTDFAPKIAIAALSAILVIVIDLVAGMRSVDPEMLSLARVHHAGGMAMMIKIRFPHALPNLFGALKTAVSLAVIGAIVGEYVGGQQGLGYLVLVAQGNFDTPRAFAAILLLSLISTALFYAVVLLEKLLIPWHVSQRTLTGL
jgi:NitT/TauT family transport system permease protein